MAWHVAATPSPQPWHVSGATHSGRRTAVCAVQVITRQEGTSLGFVEQLYVLPQQIAVANINLKQDKLPLTPANRNIPLAALQQIGDVLLVQDEGALRQPDPYSVANTTKLVGLDVVTEDGQLLGKVSASGGHDDAQRHIPVLAIQLMPRSAAELVKARKDGASRVHHEDLLVGVVQ